MHHLSLYIYSCVLIFINNIIIFIIYLFVCLFVFLILENFIIIKFKRMLKKEIFNNDINNFIFRQQKDTNKVQGFILLINWIQDQTKNFSKRYHWGLYYKCHTYILHTYTYTHTHIQNNFNIFALNVVCAHIIIFFFVFTII